MDPFIGQIALVAFNFAPVGWAFCDGSLLSIDQNTALFSLIGTTYGGDGQTTFALPDLRSRVPIHQGQGTGLSTYVIGQTGGTETWTLTGAQLPSHNHQAQCVSALGNTANPANAVWAKAGSDTPYQSNTTGSGAMANAAIGPAGGNQAHPNIMPYQAINYVIALEGVFPSQS